MAAVEARTGTKVVVVETSRGKAVNPTNSTRMIRLLRRDTERSARVEKIKPEAFPRKMAAAQLQARKAMVP